jgi:integrase
MRSKARKTKPQLPPFVVLKGPKDVPDSEREWHIRVGFPTHQRDDKGRIKYLQYTRRCEPKTFERAGELVEQLRAMHRGVLEEQTKTPTVGDYFQSFLASKRLSTEARTADGYEDLYNRYVANTAFASILLPEVKPRDVQALYDAMLQRGVSVAMLRKVHTILTMAFKRALLWEDVAKNPATGITLPRADENEAAAMSRSEARKVVEACRTRPDFFIFEFGLATGLRPQELLAVRWGDIDLEGRTINVRQAIAFDLRGGGYKIKKPKTKTSVRTIGFGEEIREGLIRHSERRTARIAALKKRIAEPVELRNKGRNYQKRLSVRQNAREKLERLLKLDLVFPASNGGPMSRANVDRRQFKEMLKAAGIERSKYSLKSLRHTNASLLAEKINPKKLQQHLGHRKIETTLRWYVHVHEDSRSEAGEKLSELLYSR